MPRRPGRRSGGSAPPPGRRAGGGGAAQSAPASDGPRRRSGLAAAAAALRSAKPISGVRLLPFDDPYTKTDKAHLVPDERRRRVAGPPRRPSPRYPPGAALGGGEVVGGGQRRGRKVPVHPFRGSRLAGAVREAIEAEALGFPIAGTAGPRGDRGQPQTPRP